MTPEATNRRQETGHCAAVRGGHSVGLKLLFAVMVAVLAFIPGGQDAFRWRERAAQTSTLFGQQTQSLPAREHLRAIVAQDRKDPLQTNWSDPAALPLSLLPDLADETTVHADLPVFSEAVTGPRLQAFMPRGPPGVAV